MTRTACRLFIAWAAFAAARISAAEPPAETLTLAEARAIALRNHPRVAIAKLRALVSEEALKADQAAYFPTANAYVDAVRAGNDDNTRILAGAVNSPSVYDKTSEGLAVSELITDFGQTKNFVASARLSARAQQEAEAAAELEITLNVDANFFATLQAEATLRVARQTVEARQTLVDQITALARNKLRSELDVSFANVDLEQARLVFESADNAYAAFQARLAEALGYRETRAFRLIDVPRPPETPPDVDALVQTAFATRPDLLRLRYDRDAALRLALAERDRNYPTISVVGTVGNALSHDPHLPNKYEAGGVQMDIPLFAGGLYLARQREAELQAKASEEAIRAQEDDVSRDVRLAWLNFNTAVQRLRTTEKLLVHAGEALDLSRARYRIGSASIVELSDAEVNASAAQIAEANARYDELIDLAVLYYQTGSMK